jgi:hypothetical protein
MCIDEAAGRIYPHGGLDGERNLGLRRAKGPFVPRHEDPVHWPGRRSLTRDCGAYISWAVFGVSDDASMMI